MVMRKIQTFVSNDAPQTGEALWIKPLGNGFAIYFQYNGKWQLLKTMKDMGTNDPMDDIEGSSGIDDDAFNSIMNEVNKAIVKLEGEMEGKQDIINDLSAIRNGASKGATALQNHQDISGKADVSYVDGKIVDAAEAPDSHTVAMSMYAIEQEFVKKSDLANVAKSGSYNDLSDKPTLPIVPANVSAFANDAGYLTSHQSLTDYVTKEALGEDLEGYMSKDSVVKAGEVYTEEEYNALSAFEEDMEYNIV